VRGSFLAARLGGFRGRRRDDRSSGARQEHAIQSDATILVAGNRIVAVGATSSTPVPASATIVNGRGKWIVPGLVDGHVHFFQSGNLYTRPDAADFTKWMPYAKEVARNQARLPATFKVWLASGVTSVVDIGGPFWNFEMRDTALQTRAAPRVAVCRAADLDDPRS
jgi:cytosine/adenosine deaminase-related metal-dependent hydrolase